MMMQFVLRRIVPVCLFLVVIFVAFSAPGAAKASLGEQCSGDPIVGKGSELQQGQQALWGSSFNEAGDKSPRACSGTQGAKLEPGVGYLSVGNRIGLEAWGVNGHTANFGLEDAFIGTGEPPNATEREEIVSHSSLPAGDGLQTIPVLQYPVAIIVQLPLHCLPDSKASGGMLALSNKTLEEIWRGKSDNWEEVLGGSTGKRFLKTEGCEPNPPIPRVVTSESSGPSATLKKYLYLVIKEKTVVGGRGW